MKRYSDLFSQIIDLDNLIQAHENARKGKSHYTEVQMVNQDPRYYANEIRASLINKTYRTSQYKLKEIYEPKQRTIHKLPYYPDRIVHHAIMQVIQPIWDRIFIYDLYSAIPGKGLHAGSYRLRAFLRDIPGTQYCLKFDVSKFYPSMDHDMLLSLIERKIKCPGTLGLLEEIIRSTEGVPIGNYLSQYFGNIYLNEFDHWLKEEKGIKYYIRYCDDGVILHSDRDILKQLMVEIENYFSALKLKLNPKTAIFPVDRCGIDFLGYRHYRGYTLLRKSSARNLKTRIKGLGDLTPESAISSIMSSLGWIKHCNSFHLVKKWILENYDLKSLITNYSIDLGISNPLEKFIWRNYHG
jgi:retron-type reverse transcriptase